MGWSIGFDEKWQRDVGYGVPAECDDPDCHAEIDRGLSFVCGGEALGGTHGCGLYFCDSHLQCPYDEATDDAIVIDGEEVGPVCRRCVQRLEKRDDSIKPFTPKRDLPVWINWKLTDASWARWRAENEEAVKALHAQLATT